VKLNNHSLTAFMINNWLSYYCSITKYPMETWIKYVFAYTSSEQKSNIIYWHNCFGGANNWVWCHIRYTLISYFINSNGCMRLGWYMSLKPPMSNFYTRHILYSTFSSLNLIFLNLQGNILTYIICTIMHFAVNNAYINH
jgi:hypothetical protein